MKKVLSVVLAASMVLGMTACGSSSSTTTTTAAETTAAGAAEETTAAGAAEETTAAEAAASSDAKFYIGGSGPITGGAALYGIAVQRGGQIAVDEINANGGINGYQVE